MEDHLDRIQGIVTHIDDGTEGFHGAVTPPIYDNTIYRFPDFEAVEEANNGNVFRYSYSKNANPTTQAVESKLAKLEKGEAAKCFSSGTAAIYTALLAVLDRDSHVITVNNVYGRVSSFLNEIFSRFGVTTTFVDGTNTDAFRQAITKNTKLIYLESPTSWHFELQDIRKVAEVAKEHNLFTLIDNTWATPAFQIPLELGIDAVIHSASKYLGGHSDLVAGAVVGRHSFISSLPQLGAVLSPHESAKLMKGLRTLAIRMEKHQSNAARIASFLEVHPKIKCIHYPGTSNYKQSALAQKQMSGNSGLMSFELDADKAGVKRFINSLKLIAIGGSWGGFESIIYAAAMDDDVIDIYKRGFALTQVRLSAGLEPVSMLIEDLAHALEQV